MGQYQQDKLPLPATHKKAPLDYMNAREAAHALGLPYTTFRFYVQKGLIPRTVPEGREEGYYLEALILALVPVMQERKSLSFDDLRKRMIHIRDRIMPRTPLALTDWIAFTDLPFVQQLDIALYGVEDTVDMTTTWQWWQANRCMCRVLYNAKNRQDIWGVLTAMPMREETIYKLLRHEMAERDITPDDILTYQPGHAYSCYVPSLAIFPERRAHLRLLLQSFFDFWCELAPDITIQRLFAFATSEQGMSAIHHLFFSPRYDLSKDPADPLELVPFELIPMRPGNPSMLVKSFQRCMEKKMQAQG